MTIKGESLSPRANFETRNVTSDELVCESGAELETLFGGQFIQVCDFGEKRYNAAAGSIRIPIGNDVNSRLILDGGARTELILGSAPSLLVDIIEGSTVKLRIATHTADIEASFSHQN